VDLAVVAVAAGVPDRTTLEAGLNENIDNKHRVPLINKLSLWVRNLPFCSGLISDTYPVCPLAVHILSVRWQEM
jgi:hypothetical protein